MMTPEQSVAAAMTLCTAGAVAALAVSRNKTLAGWLAFLATTASAVFVLSGVARVLTIGPSLHPVAVWSVPRLRFVLRFHVDGLAAIFLLLAAVIAVPAALYSIQYMKHYAEYGVGRYYPYFLLFLAGLYGLFSTTDMMWFFFGLWQLMVLPGYALIRFENKERENVRAAYKYLVMMEVACAAIMIGTGLVATGNGVEKYGLGAVSQNLPLLLNARPGLTALAFALFLAGFGVVMGMWPFGQLWLPDADPATPSPVSAMLCGVMIKIGVYGLLRDFLWLVPRGAGKDFPLARWGSAVAVLGTITLFTGTMQALKQEQSKRLLAFHSIGQIGYILLGAGACMALLPANGPNATVFATIALYGALFHALNHGLFKGLLFLNAGSLLRATGTQDLNKMGGLMKYMPLTAITALVASFSISGVPLFNGFASKWTIYVALIQGSGSARYLAFCAVVAIMTSVLTLASFIKFCGVSFLSRASALVTQEAAQNGRLEVGWMMQVPQVVLAFACVLLGVAPAIGFRLFQHALEASKHGFGGATAGASPLVSGPLQGVGSFGGAARYAPVGIVVLLGLMFAVAYGIAKLGGATRRAAVPWLCGYVREADCHRYVAHNFYGEIKRYFRWLGGAPRSETGRAPAWREH
jgi:hydrogenase-4 component B